MGKTWGVKKLLISGLALLMLLAATSCGRPESKDPDTAYARAEEGAGEEGRKADNLQAPVVEAEAPSALVPAVMVADTLYLLTGEQFTDEEIINGRVASEVELSGEITSVVPLTQWPAESGQANIEVKGSPYILWEDGVLVHWNNNWVLFATEERRAEDY